MRTPPLRGGSKLPPTLVLVRPRPPSLRPHQQKKPFCFFDLAGVRFFLKEERTFFFGVLPSKYSGRWRNNADSVLPNYFLGKGFGKTSTDLDFASGGGWGGILRFLPPFSFGGIRGGLFLGKALKVGINFLSLF